MSDPTPRPEHPRPQFLREAWTSLNGPWTFRFDPDQAGGPGDRSLGASTGFDRRITVPFAPESRLSGVAHTGFIHGMWYHRRLVVPAAWAGRRVVLHFGGVDYESEVFVDGSSAGLHFGGSSPFDLEVTNLARPGEAHDLVVRVRDVQLPEGSQPVGKQSDRPGSYGCRYTRTTGIWQTVWLEAAGRRDRPALRDVQVLGDLDGGRAMFVPRLFAEERGCRLAVEVLAGGRVVGSAEGAAASGLPVTVQLSEVRPWSPEDPFLYDIRYELRGPEGDLLDEVASYFGLRKVHVEGDRFFLNNRPLYQRLVLDQGFYPEGVWTAPSDEALKRDIELSMAAGFGGARLHQKIFEERFHYWADRLGYLTWGEFPSWGCDPNDPAAAGRMLAEWRGVIERDRNHPSIVAWTPWNETGRVSSPPEHDRAHLEAYALCKALDPTRPVNDSSGYVHRRTDLWTVHNYEGDGRKLAEVLRGDGPGRPWRNHPELEVAYGGQPYIVDEFGGIKWIPPGERAFAENSWGYGQAPRSLEEFYARLEALVEALLGLEHVRGYCYTQLTDVEQEQNGIYRYDRSEKFDMARIRAIFSRLPKS